ncbi:MAG: carbonate dehydratase [Phycisphaeraceae bacterium]|nr:carbonate dehydratase [Phycisphaerales bacterium]QOJ16736.1 MAG: carbonate dehydratase [Phycisphaeraceae bacterium]
MSHTLANLFENNRRWAAARTQQDPGFFARLAAQQAPRYLWIGCADSRVPANEIVGLDPGELFVHRNVANVVSHTDLNCLAVLQYAVEVLKVEHIIVCGHYGCGGVAAALMPNQLGLIDNWLRLVRDVRMRHVDELDAIEPFEVRVNRLCELNVRAQLARVSQTTIVQNAWARGQSLAIHGWIYDIRDGLLKDLELRRVGIEDVPAPYRMTTPPAG